MGGRAGAEHVPEMNRQIVTDSVVRIGAFRTLGPIAGAAHSTLSAPFGVSGRETQVSGRSEVRGKAIVAA